MKVHSTEASHAPEYSPLRALFALAPALRQAAGHTLSLYMPARPEGYDARLYQIVFGDLMHRYRERLDEKELHVLKRELPRVRAHLEIVRPAGCAALAAFAQSEPDVLELIRLPYATAERLEVGDPLLAPALRQIEQLPPALIVVVDKERSRMFSAILDDVFPAGGRDGAEVRHSRAGWTSASSNQRKAENHARANLEVAVGEAGLEMASGVYSRMYTAGPQEARGEFDRLIPKRLRASVAGHLSASLDSPSLEHDLRRELARLRLAEAS